MTRFDQGDTGAKFHFIDFRQTVKFYISNLTPTGDSARIALQLV